MRRIVWTLIWESDRPAGDRWPAWIRYAGAGLAIVGIAAGVILKLWT